MTCQTVDFTIRKGDVLPAIAATLNNTVAGVDTAADLTGATVQFIYKPRLGGTSVTRTATIVGAPTLGKVTYQWIAADTATAGEYNAYWRVTFSGGSIGTYPNGSYNLIKVSESL